MNREPRRANLVVMIMISWAEVGDQMRKPCAFAQVKAMVGNVGDAEPCQCGDACLELGYGVRALVGDVKEAFEALAMNMRHSEAHADPCHLDDAAANLYSGLHSTASHQRYLLA